MPWIALRHLPDSASDRASIRKRSFYRRMAFIGAMIPVPSVVGWWLLHFLAYRTFFIVLGLAFFAHGLGFGISVFAAIGSLRREMAFTFVTAVGALLLNGLLMAIIFLCGAILNSPQC